MSVLTVVKLATVWSVVLLLFGLALRARTADLTYLLRNWRLGLQAFVAMFLIVPGAALLIARAFDLNWAVEIALVCMALSPLPPILPGKQLKAGGEGSYVTGLLFGASIVSIIVAPIWITVASRLFGMNVSLSPQGLIKPILISVLIPVVAGLIAAPLLGGKAERVRSIAMKVGTLLLVVVVIAFVIILGPTFWKLVGDGTILAFAGLAVLGLAAGYWLGGPNEGDRAALALAASTRHPGVAIAVASHALADIPLVPAAVVLFLIVSMAISIPFLVLVGQRERTKG